jgi:hypothetical protein
VELKHTVGREQSLTFIKKNQKMFVCLTAVFFSIHNVIRFNLENSLYLAGKDIFSSKFLTAFFKI